MFRVVRIMGSRWRERLRRVRIILNKSWMLGSLRRILGCMCIVHKIKIKLIVRMKMNWRSGCRKILGVCSLVKLWQFWQEVCWGLHRTMWKGFRIEILWWGRQWRVSLNRVSISWWKCLRIESKIGMYFRTWYLNWGLDSMMESHLENLMLILLTPNMNWISDWFN